MRRPLIFRISSFRQQQEIAAVEDHFARDDFSGRIGNETDDREVSDGFAGARFADDAERFAAFELKRDVIDGFNNPVFGFEVSPEVFNFEKISVWGRFKVQSSIGPIGPIGPDTVLICGSSASRNPSPRKFKEKSVSAIVTPGKINCHGKIPIF